MYKLLFTVHVSGPLVPNQLDIPLSFTYTCTVVHHFVCLYTCIYIRFTFWCVSLIWLCLYSLFDGPICHCVMVYVRRCISILKIPSRQAAITANHQSLCGRNSYLHVHEHAEDFISYVHTDSSKFSTTRVHTGPKQRVVKDNYKPGKAFILTMSCSKLKINCVCTAHNLIVRTTWAPSPHCSYM